MPIASDTLYQFPSFSSAAHKSTPKPDRLDYSSDEGLDVDIFGQDMAGSPSPFIKDEPLDMNFTQRFSTDGFDMEHQYSNQHFDQTQDNAGVNPNDLQMNASFMNQQFGSHNMSGSYNFGQATFNDDELQDLVNLDESNNHPFNSNNNNFNDQHNQQHFFNDSNNGGPVNINEGKQMNQVFSHTPEGAPIQSPFVNGGFNYGQFQQQPRHPHGLVTQGGSMPNGGFVRPRMPSQLERQASDSRSPMTPKTVNISGLHIGTPESGSYGSHPMMHRHQKSASGQWDHTPNSAGSWLDSPLSSPHAGSLHHPQISEVMHAKHASLPAKVEHNTALQTQEAKRKKRRESHNAVERRRRDNINERIHDLSRLVPQHRLEDEKVRKHIHNNGPLSPSITGSGISPPHATSLLAGGTGRRAAGSITQGLPLDEKDKGPNKGDILNGAVSWTRDLMWLLNEKIRREEELKLLVEKLQGTWPYEHNEEEIRMRSELIKAINSNGVETFGYSRGPGSGLRVPGHTNVAGEQLPEDQQESASPELQGGGGGPGTAQPQFWMGHDGNGPSSFSLKEEDEFTNMEMA